MTNKIEKDPKEQIHLAKYRLFDGKRFILFWEAPEDQSEKEQDQSYIKLLFDDYIGKIAEVRFVGTQNSLVNSSGNFSGMYIKRGDLDAVRDNLVYNNAKSLSLRVQSMIDNDFCPILLFMII